MPFCKHELDIAIRRLEEIGLIPVLMPNALKDMDYLQNHPESRANDLKRAFMDTSIKGIICAIGGDDTYKTIPYLMEDEEFIDAESGKLDMEKARPLAYCHGEYFGLGKALGHFGWSVRKKTTKRKR